MDGSNSNYLMPVKLPLNRVIINLGFLEVDLGTSLEVDPGTSLEVDLGVMDVNLRVKP